MKQVSGFEDPQHPTKVYHLNKALYGLQQASRAWNEKITKFLANSNVDTKLIILMFVDDGLCYCQDPHRMDSVLTTTNDIFETKVNDLKIYVGLQIRRDRYSGLIFPHQRAYLEKIIRDYGFSNSSYISTPIDLNSNLRIADSTDTDPAISFPLVNAVGSLQFASIGTKLGRTYSVNNIA